MIEWYLKVVRDNYANFSGRARRSEYWYFVLCNLLITLLLFILMFVSSIFLYLLIIYALATMIPGIAVVVRRLHDIGKSGAYYFVSFIPIDEVVDAMAHVGKLMPRQLKETAEGCLATTQTAEAFTQQLFSPE